MGSADVQGLVQGAELHVARDRQGTWWAVGARGSYGGSRDRREAIRIALDTSATAFHGRARIVVHYRYGDVAFWVTRTGAQASSQAFQDLVP